MTIFCKNKGALDCFRNSQARNHWNNVVKNNSGEFEKIAIENARIMHRHLDDKLKNNVALRCLIKVPFIGDGVLYNMLRQTKGLNKSISYSEMEMARDLVLKTSKYSPRRYRKINDKFSCSY